MIRTTHPRNRCHAARLVGNGCNDARVKTGKWRAIKRWGHQSRTNTNELTRNV